MWIVNDTVKNVFLFKIIYDRNTLNPWIILYHFIGTQTPSVSFADSSLPKGT